ncbi:carboxylesterase/lipase family protein [Paracidobacterium acidisoli]|uniref:Carboxylic ester hydrolase n=1 Tax=Paracidobacterium acidisoli TaxID=2303751 RepID=A0A372IQZ7_9BACT|nr:carboxylesterase family protein [Paracidobacterium acidisoli]MBT9330232.1 carboxylesterase family protein [Paracidobacterium acidisoli]
MAMLALPGYAKDNLKVKTDKGRVEGRLSADGQVRAFLGVPYAAPPVGSLRWKAPQPAEKWSGVRQATEFGHRCMQPQIYDDMRFRDAGQSEDCLTLNIWTSAKDKHAKQPVMVWIFGGGFTGGGTSEPRQDGEHLAHKGVVVVSMNYRLGVFGFFTHADLAAESPQHAAGNYGLMDQTAALQWVKKNIAEFGGDPAQVTIFGESAGSFSVSAQMASPLARGLFERAIGESGGAFSATLPFQPLATREVRDADYIKRATGTSDLAQLRAMSAEDLLAAVSKKVEGTPERFGPDVDGYFLPESVPQIYAEGKQAHVPLLAGWNRDEGTENVLASAEQPTVENMKAQAEKLFGDRAADFLKAYAATSDAEAVRAMEDYAGDKFIAYSTWAWLEAQVKTGGAPVYRYKFEMPQPGDKFHSASMGTFHSDDIEYVFGVLDSRPDAKWTPEDYKMSDLIETYWTNFAKTGDPNGTSTAGAPGTPVPNWPQYKAPEWQVMHLNANSEARPDEHRDRDLFLQDVWSKPAAE